MKRSNASRQQDATPAPKQDSLREQVYQYLKDAMSEGTLRYGEFLDQDIICERLNVSKTPLRDALIRLEASSRNSCPKSSSLQGPEAE